MAITNAVKNKLNKMNRAAQDAFLGDVVQKIAMGGSVIPSAAQISASAVLVYNPRATTGFHLVQVERSGSLLSLSNAYKVTRSGGSLTIGVVNSGSFTANDIIHYIIG